MKHRYLFFLVALTLICACSEGFEKVDHPSSDEKPGTEELRDILKSLDTRKDRDGVMYSIEVRDGEVIAKSPRRVQDKDELPVDSPSREELIENNSKEPIENRVQPDLLAEYQDLAKGKREDQSILAMILFVDDVELPMLPEPNEEESKDSPYNKKVAELASRSLEILTEIRSQEIRERLNSVPELANIEILHVHSLINAVDVRMKLSDIEHLIKLPDVQYISYQQEQSPIQNPPSRLSQSTYRGRGNNISDGRALIDSDPYYPYTGGWIGIFDTGAAFPGTHVLLRNRYFFTRDCVHGTRDRCRSGKNLDPWDNHGHGSFSASILSGTAALGNNSRGVTNVIMDSFKVYQDSGNSAYLDYPSVVRAYEAAFPALDRTVLAEMQGTTNYRGCIAVAANKAFDLGIATAAAAGNYGPWAGSIASPGNAQKVLAFGAYDVQGDRLLMSYSGRGPTKDGRVKPDLITPTNTRAADIHSGPTSLSAFGGTSGSSPYGAGAAALQRNFMRSTKSTPEPGLIYAALINGGSLRSYGNLSASQDNGINDIGAGRLVMHTNGISFWGSVVVGSKHVNIPLDTSGTSFESMKMSIWWPEEPNQSHKKFRIGFRNYQCGSWSGYWPYYQPTSVWQKYTSFRQCSGKKWYLQIIPENNLNRNRRVYYHVDFS